VLYARTSTYRNEVKFFASTLQNQKSPSKKCANAYTYGFNGKEMDDEVKGDGSSYDFGARIYDPRLGRFLSIDPHFKVYPEFSPYSYALNNPIRYKDIEGKGADGGFSVQNTSNKPVLLVGSKETVNHRVFFPNSEYSSPPVAFVLNPGERYETVVKEIESGTGYSIKQYTGVIKDIKTGATLRTTEVGDVDFIRIPEKQKIFVGDKAFTSEDIVGGSSGWNEGTTEKEVWKDKGGGQIKLFPQGIGGMNLEGTVNIVPIDQLNPQSDAQVVTDSKTSARGVTANEVDPIAPTGNDTPVEGTKERVKPN